MCCARNVHVVDGSVIIVYRDMICHVELNVAEQGNREDGFVEVMLCCSAVLIECSASGCCSSYSYPLAWKQKMSLTCLVMGVW